MHEYTILLIPNTTDDGWTVTVPASPGYHAAGATIEDAITNAREAIMRVVTTLSEHDQHIPVDMSMVVASLVIVPTAPPS